MNKCQLTKCTILANMRYTLAVNDNLDFALINDVKVIAQVALFDDDLIRLMVRLTQIVKMLIS